MAGTRKCTIHTVVGSPLWYCNVCMYVHDCEYDTDSFGRNGFIRIMGNSKYLMTSPLLTHITRRSHDSPSRGSGWAVVMSVGAKFSRVRAVCTESPPTTNEHHSIVCALAVDPSIVHIIVVVVSFFTHPPTAPTRYNPPPCVLNHPTHTEPHHAISLSTNRRSCGSSIDVVLPSFHGRGRRRPRLRQGDQIRHRGSGRHAQGRRGPGRRRSGKRGIWNFGFLRNGAVYTLGHTRLTEFGTWIFRIVVLFHAGLNRRRRTVRSVVPQPLHLIRCFVALYLYITVNSGHLGSQRT